MGLTRTTPPKILPVTLSELKGQLNLSLDDQSRDARLLALGQAATTLAERVTGRAFITQSWRLAIDDHFPLWEIALPRPPVQSITSIQYIDENGQTQTLDAAKYKLTADAQPALLTPAYNEVWPTTRWETEAVKITYVAGYGDGPANVPEDARLAILLAVQTWFDMPFASGELLPAASLMLLRSLKVGTYAPSFPI